MAGLGVHDDRRVVVVTHRGGAFDSQGLLSHDAATVPQGATTGRLLGAVGRARRPGGSVRLLSEIEAGS